MNYLMTAFFMATSVYCIIILIFGIVQYNAQTRLMASGHLTKVDALSTWPGYVLSMTLPLAIIGVLLLTQSNNLL